MNRHRTIDIEPGASIEATCDYALRECRTYSDSYTFIFNGVELYCTPDSTVSDLLKQWDRDRYDQTVEDGSPLEVIANPDCLTCSGDGVLAAQNMPLRFCRCLRAVRSPSPEAS